MKTQHCVGIRARAALLLASAAAAAWTLSAMAAPAATQAAPSPVARNTDLPHGSATAFAVVAAAPAIWYATADEEGRVVVRGRDGQIAAAWDEPGAGAVSLGATTAPPRLWIASHSAGLRAWDPQTRTFDAALPAELAQVIGVASGCGGACLAAAGRHGAVGRVDIIQGLPRLRWWGRADLRTKAPDRLCATANGWVVTDVDIAFDPQGQRHKLAAHLGRRAEVGDSGGPICGAAGAWVGRQGWLIHYQLQATVSQLGAPAMAQLSPACAATGAPGGERLGCAIADEGRPGGWRWVNWPPLEPFPRPALANALAAADPSGLVAALGPNLLRLDETRLLPLGRQWQAPLAVARDGRHHRLAVLWPDGLQVYGEDGAQPERNLPLKSATVAGRGALGFDSAGGVRWLDAAGQAWRWPQAQPNALHEPGPEQIAGAPIKVGETGWLVTMAGGRWLWTSYRGLVAMPANAPAVAAREPSELLRIQGNASAAEEEAEDEWRGRRRRYRAVQMPELAQAGSQRLYFDADCTVKPWFSEAGNRVALTTGDRRLCVHQLPAGLPAACTSDVADVNAVHWSRDGSTLLVRATAAGSAQWTLRDGRDLAVLWRSRPGTSLARRLDDDVSGVFGWVVLVDPDDRPAFAIQLRNGAVLVGSALPAELRALLPQRSKKHGKGEEEDDTDDSPREEDAQATADRRSAASRARSRFSVDLLEKDGLFWTQVRRRRDGSLTLSVPARGTEFSADERVLVTLQGRPGLWDPETGRLLADYRHSGCGVARMSIVDGGRLTVTVGPRAMVVSSWPDEGRSTPVPASAEEEIAIAAQDSSLAITNGEAGSARWIDLRHPTDSVAVPSSVGSGGRLSPNGEMLASLRLATGRAISVVRRGGEVATLMDPRPALGRALVGADHTGRRWAVLRSYGDSQQVAVVDTAAARWQTLDWNLAESTNCHCNWWPRDDRVICSSTPQGLQVFSTTDGQAQWSCPSAQSSVLPGQDPQRPLLTCIRPTGLEVYDPSTAAHRWLTR